MIIWAVTCHNSQPKLGPPRGGFKRRMADPLLVGLNCKKNNTTCEGYPSEHAWKGGNGTWTFGSQKPNNVSIAYTVILGACIKPSTSPTCTSTKSASPRSSVEMDIDSTLLHHFKFSLSRILSIAQDEQNPYLRFILAMATRRRALMHAVLGLSGAHWSLKSSKADVETRGCYHLDYAIADLRVVSEKYTSTQEYVEDAAIGQALVVFLRCVIAPEERGKYCKLLEFVRYLVVHQGASDPEFQAFLVGFIVTYDVSNAVVSLGYRPSLQTEILQRAKELTTQSPAFLGVLDGFSIQLARITRIRDSVRVCRARGIPIKGDRVLLNEASAIDAELRAWQSSQPVNSDEHILSLLYRQCTWVYLYRTLLPASIHDIRLRDAVDAGIVALTTLTPDSAAYAMLLLPLFLLGCSAFQPSQRPAIDAAFGSLARYRKYAAVGYAQGVMHQMWQMMDAGDDRAWDWEDFTSKASLDWLVV